MLNKIIKPWKGKSDGTLYRAEVLEKRINPNNNKEEYYVHYEGLDRRLDEWIPGKFSPKSPKPTPLTVYQVSNRFSGDKLEQEIIESASCSKTNQTDESMVTRNKKRKYDEINHVQASIADLDPATAALEKEHEAITKVFSN